MPKLTTPQLVEIFNAVKPLLKIYEPPLTARADIQGRYDLWSEKDLVIEGKKRKEIAFAALIVQSSYVGFYFVPTYTHEESKATLHPDLLKKLKGKACFHLQEANPDTLEHISDALASGFRMYQERGWV
ncbi:MAG: DUF1801 domain-containing protein [Sphingobacteriaceae bacterium]|nr:DUF1801 domain-containing protein [Cytophagaceae bacterium]